MSKSNPYREHYSSEGQTQISARIDDDLKADIKQLADERGISQTELIAQSLAETVADAGMVDAGSEIKPDDPTARELYQAMLDRLPTAKDVPLAPHKRLLAQDTQIPADQIPIWIKRLADNGYATIRAGALGTAKTRYGVSVKPPTAEPREWSPYDDDPDPDDDEVSEADDKIDETSDGDPITDDEEDPVAADAGIESESDQPIAPDGGDIYPEDDSGGQSDG